MARTLGLKRPDPEPAPPPGARPARSFQPAWWCRNPHLQTLWPVFFRRRVRPRLRRERLELPDGDFLDLDWTWNRDDPLVVLLHGLEGSARSHYARGMLDALPRFGLRAVLMHFRGCSGEPNRLARAYHSGDSGDIAFVLDTLRAREPRTPLGAIGYSLGGNVLLKYLGERGAATPLSTGVAVSVPFLLDESTARMNRGFSRLYQWHLLDKLKAGVRRKARHLLPPVALDETRPDAQLLRLRRPRDRTAARVRGAGHYYTQCSSRRYLHGIGIPTLIVHAADDPFMPQTVIPTAGELSADVSLDLHAHGGHVGFVAGTLPWRPRYWLEERVPAWLQRRLVRESGPATASIRQYG
ncbi:MAG: hydrolase [Chromatiales bacterium]|nr:hydrolase [Chromatiales bacterium]